MLYCSTASKEGDGEGTLAHLRNPRSDDNTRVRIYRPTSTQTRARNAAHSSGQNTRKAGFVHTTRGRARTCSLRSELKSSFFFLGSLPGSGFRVTNSWIYAMGGIEGGPAKIVSRLHLDSTSRVFIYEGIVKPGGKSFITT